MLDAAEVPVTFALEAEVVSAPEALLLSDTDTDTDALLIAPERTVDTTPALDCAGVEAVELLPASESDVPEAEKIDAALV